MKASNWQALCAYMQSVWGRTLSEAQKAAGWQLLHGLPDEAVEGAILAIAEDGREQMPTWPVVLKTARQLAERMRDTVPALPAGDTLSDTEHQAAMLLLRTRETPEQRRRADRVTQESRGLPMLYRLRIARDTLAGEGGQIAESQLWDAFLDGKLREARTAAGILLPVERADLV